MADADLVVLPGSRATVADLGWLRSRGLAGPIAERARRRQPVLGICGGYQMLGELIDDPVESGAGQVPGLGLLPVRAVFGPDKQLGQRAGTACAEPVRGYLIHHGVVTMTPERVAGLSAGHSSTAAGWVCGGPPGTLENDGFRRAFLAGGGGRRAGLPARAGH